MFKLNGKKTLLKKGIYSTGDMIQLRVNFNTRKFEYWLNDKYFGNLNQSNRKMVPFKLAVYLKGGVNSVTLQTCEHKSV